MPIGASRDRDCHDALSGRHTGSQGSQCGRRNDRDRCVWGTVLRSVEAEAEVEADRSGWGSGEMRSSRGVYGAK